ncbi:MAG: hypothetical protein ACRDUY_16260, partial [Nitriliruptorales bacterium]
TGTAPGGPADPQTGTTRTPGGASGDTSHCTEDGRQHDVIYNAPPCVPKWTAGTNNGGATYQGVTKDTIKVLLFRENKNEQVTFLLNKEGLRATREEDIAFMEAAERYLNDHYELYGRKVDLRIFDATECPETPPDIPACRAEAQRALKEEPFAVIWPVPLYPEVFDEFAKAGVISLGGWHFDNSYFAGRRPYRWDVFMDGTRSVDFIAEYYCKKLANETASHAGRIIHPSLPNGGARDLQPRRLGITVPDDPARVPTAERLKELVSRCDGTEPVIYAFDQDIERSLQQASPITQAMIEDRITTVTMLSDPIAPIFRTNNQTRNNYFPEILMPGLGLHDFDKLGRLYDQQQMAHAFGPSHLQVFPDHSETDASRIWRAADNEGDACQSCNLNGSYFIMMGTMLQMAGPNLNPATVEQGTLSMEPRGGWEQTGGNPNFVLSAFGPGDYTSLSDLKEVYWDAGANSRIDGRPGAYVAMSRGRRWAAGELPSTFDIPVPPR